MLSFLVLFNVLIAIQQLNPLFSTQAAVHCPYNSCPSTYKYGCPNTKTCFIDENSFPNLDLWPEDSSMVSILHLYYIDSGHKTHNPGLITHNNLGYMTHNTAGPMTHYAAGPMAHNTVGHIPQYTFYIFIPFCHCLMPGCITGLQISKLHHNITNCGKMTKEKKTPSCQCHHMIIVPCILYKKTENSIHFLLHKQGSSSQYSQKQHKYYKCSALPLFLAINRSIYYLLNGTFNHAHDINYLINKLVLMLQQYITRHNDFKHRWFTLLLSGLLTSQKNSLQFFIELYLRIHIVSGKLFRLQKIRYTMNKIVVLSSWLHFICLEIGIKFITLHNPSSLLVSDQILKSTTGFVGGGSSARTDYEFLKQYVVSTEVQLKNPDEFNYVYGRHCTLDNAMQEIRTSGEAQLVCNIPLALVANILTSIQANEVAKEHNLHVSRKSLTERRTAVESHVCTMSCNRCVTMFKPVNKNQKSIRRQHGNKNEVKEKKKPPKVGRKSQGKTSRISRNHKYYIKENIKFPPSPPSKRLMHKIISGFCNDTHPSKFEEAGCAVCGQLVVMTKLIKMADVKCSLDPLVRIGVTRLPRNSVDDPIKEMDGPIVDASCKHMCHECLSFLEKKVIPPMALANGLWVGNVPKELSDLTFVERLLVSRVRSNRCIVHVLKGGWKMRANAIMFPTPVPKLCNILPPPIEDLDEVIAFMFTGVARPTEEDMKRTPMLARRRYISAALEWLKINHSDYADVQISQENLKLYPEEGPPVSIDYRSSVINKHKEATSVFDMEDEDGVHEGECPFVVHGLTGENYSTLSKDATHALALQHLIKDQNILFVGHGTNPESMFKNSKLFPSMMPWLFPYGLGGIGNSNIIGPMSSITQKKYLLMYHDKRFQTDPGFPLIAFNQEQIQQSSSASFVTAEKPYFAEVARRLMTLDKTVLDDITNRMMKGERVKPETNAEIACFRILGDIDAVGGRVKGSLTSKKYMRNNVWSLISYIGAPSWFITLSPADINHPICIYFADENITFKPELYFKKADDAYRLVTSNPVAAARFFHIMCENFIKHVLGFGKKHPGLYGETKAFYGTVEQQGRLTLHLHMLIWIKGALSPQVVRDKILDPDSDFQKLMVQYLESVHQGEFFDGKLEDVIERVDEYQKNPEYVPPTKTMPEAPPPLCTERNDCNICDNCKALTGWWAKFKNIVDDLVKRSNRHNDCSKSVRPCLRKGKCKARFPRDIVETTMVDPATGALKIKKGEAWINFFSPILTFLVWCNTDTTSLLSGTAIKATVGYITDYVTKPGLNTYSMFDTIRQIFERNETLLTVKENIQNSARSLVTKMVNALTAKLEIGSPMASMYLLGNPDHYTSHEFVNFYWRSFVREACSVFSTPLEEINNIPEKVMLNKSKGKFVALSNVHDYIYRPSVFGSVNLYDWIRCANKKYKPAKKGKEDNYQDDMSEDTDHYENDTDSEDELDIIGNKFLGGGINIDECDSESEWVDSDHELENMEDELNIDENVQFKEDDTPFYSFLPKHPQYNTHQIQCKYLSDFVVPNFIGGTLPRCDQGDHEYYCSTMLTLFKPWRTGHDLKSTEETWEEAFNKHIFSPAQKNLINNFNLRYECLDARDDYSAQMKDNNKDNKFWENPENNPLDQEYTGWKDNDEDLNDEMYLTGSSRQNDAKEEEMRHVEQTVAGAGWLDKSPDGINKIDTDHITPTVDNSGSQWTSLIQSIRKKFIADRSKNLPTGPNKPFDELHGTDKVFVDTMTSYLSRKFVPDQPGAINVLESVVQKFKLNTEQERAFRIVANHATINNPTQLKMYLGGMGGTGKSQVLKALVEFFRERNESHRIIIVAPTGSAAALLNGSTYHSVLNIGSDRARNDATSQSNVRERLDGVDYIFLDEISMVACHELYQISASLAKARNMTETPFGGLNMIFAGDFAQLKPVFGSPLYSHTVGTSLDASMSVRSQQSAIGKALWHQVTTVVILRQNMRQNTQSSKDSRFRTALENMRYAQCTQDDIDFLKTRIAGKNNGQPNIAKKRFRNVSIITELNSQKDQLNKLGSLRFATETGQKLTEFFSDDELGEDIDPSTLSSVRKKDKKSMPSSKKYLSPDMQDAVWNLRHSASEHIPGKLSLCIGLPVMIRNNDATELCITKGQEGHVVGWKSGIGSRGQLVLETLYVKLDRPAKNINIEGLPENVVPLMKVKKSVKCTFPNGVSIPIRRSQVQVLPNFAMTVYSSQGKTRPDNVVILNSCRDHLSYYTALSRSSTAEGTVIIQGFNPNKITCGAPGYLRQEFRELELMDEITRLRFEDKLLPSINGNLRNALIRQYQLLKGELYVPDVVPDTLKWTKSDPMNILKVQTDTQWQLIEKFKDKGTKYTPASGTVAIDNRKSIKRKADEISSDINADEKSFNTKVDEKKLSVTTISNKRPNNNLDVQNQDAPIGLIWDSADHSCAYDALFTVLGDIWVYNPTMWTREFGLMSSFANKLGIGYQQVSLKQKNFEDARNSVRNLLRIKNPVAFPYGRTGVDISELFAHMFTGKSIGKLKYNCTECGTISTSPTKITSLFTISRNRYNTIQEHIDAINNKTKKCSHCGNENSGTYMYNSQPRFRMIGFTQNSLDINISKTITLKSEAGPVVLPIRGAIYYTGNHFVSRIITPTGEVWYHDGIETKRQCIREGHLIDFSENSLKHHGIKGCVGVVYSV